MILLETFQISKGTKSCGNGRRMYVAVGTMCPPLSGIGLSKVVVEILITLLPQVSKFNMTMIFYSNIHLGLEIGCLELS